MNPHVASFPQSLKFSSRSPRSPGSEELIANVIDRISQAPGEVAIPCTQCFSQSRGQESFEEITDIHDDRTNFLRAIRASRKCRNAIGNSCATTVAAITQVNPEILTTKHRRHDAGRIHDWAGVDPNLNEKWERVHEVAILDPRARKTKAQFQWPLTWRGTKRTAAPRNEC